MKNNRIGKVEQDLNRFKQIVAESKSIKEVASKLGYKESGGVYSHLKMKFEEHGLNTDHFKGQGWAAGENAKTNESVKKMSLGVSTPWEEVFCKDSKYKGGGRGLLQKLVDSGKRQEVCEKCSLQEWMDEKLRLELDHINGDNRDNREENLRILCPNCHSQTETHSRRKIARVA